MADNKQLHYENIYIVDSEKEANSITHSGTFHGDEVFATVILSLVLPEVRLMRVPQVTEKAKESISYIYDIGGGELDHHQKGGNGKREDGVSYASCGLMWNKCKNMIIDKMDIDETEIDREDIFNMMDKEFIEAIDAFDNGETPTIKSEYKITNVSNLISNYNKLWDEDDLVNENVQFIKAVKLADEIFNEQLHSIISKAKAKKIIEKKIEESNYRVLVLDKHMPWEDILLNSDNDKAKDILYVIFPSRRGGYSIQCVPLYPTCFEVKKPFPNQWAGLRDKELQEITGIETARFCHNARFLCVCDELEDAIKLAKIAIER